MKRPHEALAAQILELGAAAAEKVAERLDGDFQLAFLDVASVLRSGAQALIYRDKGVSDLCNDMRRPRSFPSWDDDARETRREKLPK